MDTEESRPIINLNKRTFVFICTAKLFMACTNCIGYHFNCTQFNNKIGVTETHKKKKVLNMTITL